MHHRYRSWAILMPVMAWLMHPAPLSLAVEQAPPLRGTVSMVVTSLALVVGAEWGKGVLSLAATLRLPCYGCSLISTPAPPMVVFTPSSTDAR